MKCIAIDDEPLALDVIEDYAEKVPFLNMTGTFSNAIEAFEFLQDNEVDLIFLDIQMPHLNGVDFIRSLNRVPMIIFTTAYQEYALEGFELNAVDYLIKPISLERFLKAANKARRLYNIEENEPASYHLEHLMIKVEYSTINIRLKDILYVQGVKDYLKIVTDKKSYLTKNTMKNIENKLPSDRFLRVHKSYFISLEKIDAIERNRIIIGKDRIPVGDNYKKTFNFIIDRLRL